MRVLFLSLLILNLAYALVAVLRDEPAIAEPEIAAVAGEEALRLLLASEADDVPPRVEAPVAAVAEPDDVPNPATGDAAVADPMDAVAGAGVAAAPAAEAAVAEPNPSIAAEVAAARPQPPDVGAAAVASDAAAAAPVDDSDAPTREAPDATEPAASQPPAGALPDAAPEPDDTAVAATGEDAAAAAVPDPSSPLCLAAGPIEAVARAGEILRALGAESGSAHVVERDVEIGTLYWVHIPPRASAPEARDVARELRERGVDNFAIIEPGPLLHGVSLGVFHDRVSAERLRDELGEIGYPTAIHEAPRTRARYFIEIGVAAGVPPEIARERFAARLAGIAPGLPVAELACAARRIVAEGDES